MHEFPVYLTRSVRQRIARHVSSHSPYEVCGLLGGVRRVVLDAFPVVNTAPDPDTGYFMDPAGQIEVFNLLEVRRWDLIAIYHSHPPGQRTDPSPEDISQAFYAGVLHVILVPSQDGAQVSLRAFSIDGHSVQEVLVEVVW